MGELVIKGGTVIDPDGERRADVVVGEDGRIEAIGEDLSAAREIDAGGCVVAAGFVDLHTHLREPGGEVSETVETGSRAAVTGGYCAVVAMPNTSPAIDDASVVRDVQALGATALCDVHVSGAITLDRGGERLAPMAEMAAIGVRLFTDDGTGVAGNRLMRRAMEYAVGLGVTLAQHCEDPELAAEGVMHEGEWSSRLGLAGQPHEAEEVMVMRDIALSRLTGARIHFQHLSTRRSVEMVRQAKAEGLAVSAEATPHHISLTDAECASYDPVFKVNPPLRTPVDVSAVAAGLVDGTIDAVATDHAPHAPDLKDQPFDTAPPGMIGLETALAVALTELSVPLQVLMDRMSWTPARIAGIEDRHGGRLRAGRPANLCIFDPNTEWRVVPEAMSSRSRNTPFAGRTLRGRVRHTLMDGEVVVLDGEPQR